MIKPHVCDSAKRASHVIRSTEVAVGDCIISIEPLISQIMTILRHLISASNSTEDAPAIATVLITSQLNSEGGQVNRNRCGMSIRRGHGSAACMLEGRPSALAETVDISVLVSNHGISAGTTENSTLHIIGII